MKEKRQITENLILSAVAPIIRAGEITANLV
jgi:hypothetical protein